MRTACGVRRASALQRDQQMAEVIRLVHNVRAATFLPRGRIRARSVLRSITVMAEPIPLLITAPLLAAIAPALRATTGPGANRNAPRSPGAHPTRRRALRPAMRSAASARPDIIYPCWSKVLVLASNARKDFIAWMKNRRLVQPLPTRRR